MCRPSIGVGDTQHMVSCFYIGHNPCKGSCGAIVEDQCIFCPIQCSELFPEDIHRWIQPPAVEIPTHLVFKSLAHVCNSFKNKIAGLYNGRRNGIEIGSMVFPQVIDDEGDVLVFVMHGCSSFFWSGKTATKTRPALLLQSMLFPVYPWRY